MREVTVRYGGNRALGSGRERACTPGLEKQQGMCPRAEGATGHAPQGCNASNSCRALRHAGCPGNRVNMMCVTDRVNSFPELCKAATQFRHMKYNCRAARLPCSCEQRK